MNMIPQGFLSFKIERSKEEITPRGGLVSYYEAMRALGMRQWVDESMSFPGSNRGYKAHEFIEPLMLMLYGGGSHIEHLREIREDGALRRLVGFKGLPASSTMGHWLMRMGHRGGEKGLERVNNKLLKEYLKRAEREEYILDIDATIIEAEKQEAHWTYKGIKGYQPIIGFLSEVGLALAHEFRQGNESAGGRAMEFLKRCLEAMPEGKRVSHLRSDSAFYQAEVIDFCMDEARGFTITADQDQAVREAIAQIGEKEWRPLKSPEGIKTDREVAFTVHSMNKTKRAFALVVQRWQNPQQDLFSSQLFCYCAIATNRDDLSPEEVVWLHNQRGQAENMIKELKIGFSMEQMPSGDFLANAIYFAIGVLTYNMALLFKRFFLPEGWKEKTVVTLRWLFIQTAGKLVRHGRSLLLKIVAPMDKFRIFLEVRKRCRAFG